MHNIPLEDGCAVVQKWIKFRVTVLREKCSWSSADQSWEVHVELLGVEWVSLTCVLK